METSSDIFLPSMVSSFPHLSCLLFLGQDLSNAEQVLPLPHSEKGKLFLLSLRCLVSPQTSSP